MNCLKPYLCAVVLLVAIIGIAGCGTSAHNVKPSYNQNENQMLMSKKSTAASSSATEERNGPTLCVPVLLSKAGWDKHKLLEDLKDDWGIEIPSDALSDDDVIAYKNDTSFMSIAHMGVPVPGGEAEEFARFNYFWPEAEKIARQHKSQLLVSVVPGEMSDTDAAILLTKLVCSCLRQPNVTGVFTDATVLSPEQYRAFASPIKDGNFPVSNWIWIGIGEHDGNPCFYTWGLRDFGREEIEMSGDVEEVKIYERLYDIVAYLMNADATLKPGETIGYTPDEKLPITLSPGWLIPGETLKILLK